MTLEEMIALLNEDLKNEYAHWNFYIHAASKVRGHHREEMREFFQKEAEGEMEHIDQFKRLIIGLGGDPVAVSAPFRTDSTDLHVLLGEALRMENDVVSNYVERIDHANELQENGGMDKVHGKYIELFLEDQILDSRGDADHIREMMME